MRRLRWWMLGWICQYGLRAGLRYPARDYAGMQLSTINSGGKTYPTEPAGLRRYGGARCALRNSSGQTIPALAMLCSPRKPSSTTRILDHADHPRPGASSALRPSRPQPARGAPSRRKQSSTVDAGCRAAHDVEHRTRNWSFPERTSACRGCRLQSCRSVFGPVQP